MRDSYCVATFSFMTVRTVPVVASATRSVASLWSRDVEMNANWRASGLHFQSSRLTSSPSVARWKSGGMARADDLPRVRIDDDAVQHGHHLVAGQRELGDSQCGMRDGGDRCVDQVHLTDFTFILLIGRDPLRVGRPEEDGAVAAAPAGVIRGVAKVLHAVLGELPFLARGDVANPEIPVADEGRPLAVRGRDVVAHLTASAAGAGWRGGAPALAAPVSEHFSPPVSQDQRRALASNDTVFRSADSSIDWKGRACAVNVPLAAADSVAASFVWSKAGLRVRSAGSTRTNS